jgi:Schlafen group 3, DNA/RNA helicase domain
LDAEGHTIWITRELDQSKQWARSHRVGAERVGMVASGQARRLIAEGIFVDHKPDIAKWMLAPSGDIRSSNMLETVQNQYQIQGLELDYTIVCWDADLRREDGDWSAYKVRGAAWQHDRAIDVAKNGYRVLLTRARKGMILFVPYGDRDGLDETRNPTFYDGIAEFLNACGAKILSPGSRLTD